MKWISPKNAHQMMGNEGVMLIDVRTPAEFSERHVEGFENRPLDQLVASDFEESTPLIICLSGKRAQMAAEKMEQAGIQSPLVVEGGIQAWEQAGLELVRGKGVISLERQVRIAAGMMVLLGVILGSFVHPGFYGLSAFVGAGLTFAGMTDTCGMGILLAKAPWNQ